MKFLVYGSVNIDKSYIIDHITAPGETQAGRSVTVSAGGKGANQAVSLAKAGADVSMAGKIGPDGLWIKDLLISHNVDVTYLEEDALHTGEAIIQLSDSGQNAIILFAGGNEEQTPEQIDSILSCFSPGDWVVCQNEVPHIQHLIEKASELNLHICINPSPFDDDMKIISYELVDVVCVNEIEGASMAGLQSNDPEVILDRLTYIWPSVQFVLTAGEQGAFYGFGAERAKGDIVEVPVMDTTGAGDTFTGYYLTARYVYDYPVKDALNFACKAASIAVSRPGAMDSIPEGDEIFEEGFEIFEIKGS